MDTTIYQNQPEDTKHWTNLYFEPHDYHIYYVNIDLCHQYEISAAESQMFLCVKRPQSDEWGETDVFAGYSKERGAIY